MGAYLYLRTHLTQYVPIYDLTVIDCGSWSQCVYDWCPYSLLTVVLLVRFYWNTF